MAVIKPEVDLEWDGYYQPSNAIFPNLKSRNSVGKRSKFMTYCKFCMSQPFFCGELLMKCLSYNN